MLAQYCRVALAVFHCLAHAEQCGNLKGNCCKAWQWCAGAPLVDVVFVHGIRGGAFATWRREGVQNMQPGHKPGTLDHLYCWPSTWLPTDVPQARLLSMEYAAPASGWEVTSLGCLTLFSASCSEWISCRPSTLFASDKRCRRYFKCCILPLKLCTADDVV